MHAAKNLPVAVIGAGPGFSPWRFNVDCRQLNPADGIYPMATSTDMPITTSTQDARGDQHRHSVGANGRSGYSNSGTHPFRGTWAASAPAAAG